MAGGYDGNKYYPESDLKSTLKLVDGNECFERRAEVSLHFP